MRGVALDDVAAYLNETALFRNQWGFRPLEGESDDAFRVLIRIVDFIIPDVDRFNLTDYVAEGFNISGGQLLITGLMMFGYLALCALAAYSLIKVREIASTV